MFSLLLKLQVLYPVDDSEPPSSTYISIAKLLDRRMERGQRKLRYFAIVATFDIPLKGRNNLPRLLAQSHRTYPMREQFTYGTQEKTRRLFQTALEKLLRGEARALSLHRLLRPRFL